jgi:hypothetical protein
MYTFMFPRRIWRLISGSAALVGDELGMSARCVLDLPSEPIAAAASEALDHSVLGYSVMNLRRHLWMHSALGHLGWRELATN